MSYTECGQCGRDITGTKHACDGIREPWDLVKLCGGAVLYSTGYFTTECDRSCGAVVQRTPLADGWSWHVAWFNWFVEGRFGRPYVGLTSMDVDARPESRWDWDSMWIWWMADRLTKREIDHFAGLRIQFDWSKTTDPHKLVLA